LERGKFHTGFWWAHDIYWREETCIQGFGGHVTYIGEGRVASRFWRARDIYWREESCIQGFGGHVKYIGERRVAYRGLVGT
jgi:hypothetical protein